MAVPSAVGQKALNIGDADLREAKNLRLGADCRSGCAQLPTRGVTVHDGWIVGRSGKKGGGHGGPSKADRQVLDEAFADVRPLGGKSPNRVMPAPETQPAPIPPRTRGAGGAGEQLLVEWESSGIVLGRHPATHASIMDTLEDPTLEVEAECDLHGQSAREAEREVHRFVRESQQSGKRWVLLVVGKGLHSPGGKGTLKATVVDALSKRAPARFVLAFRTAPRHLGGTGALAIRLRDRL
jgi:DNA-nicking Smr family endonuclease